MSATCPRGSIVLSYTIWQLNVANYLLWHRYLAHILFRSCCLVMFYSTEHCLTWWKNRATGAARVFRSTSGEIIILIKSKNSRKNGNRALPPIMESDCEKWKIPQTPVWYLDRACSRFESRTLQGREYTGLPRPWRVCHRQLFCLNLCFRRAWYTRSRRCRRTRWIRDDTKPTSCASSARQFPSYSHVRARAFPSPRDTDRNETPAFN